MSRLIKTHDRVRIIKGDHAGAIGWVQSIQVEPTNEIKARVLFKIELSSPYGVVIEALPSMLVHDVEKLPAFAHAA